MSCGAVNKSTAASSIPSCDEGPPIQADSLTSREALLPLPFAELAGSGDLGAQIAALIVKGKKPDAGPPPGPGLLNPTDVEAGAGNSLPGIVMSIWVPPPDTTPLVLWKPLKITSIPGTKLAPVIVSATGTPTVPLIVLIPTGAGTGFTTINRSFLERFGVCVVSNMRTSFAPPEARRLASISKVI